VSAGHDPGAALAGAGPPGARALAGPARAIFAIPGRLDTPTGGYGYARRLLAEAEAQGLILRHWPLPDGFPAPTPAELDETERRLRAAPAGWPLLIDGLALGAMPPGLIAGLESPVVALCHHPLGLESGLAGDAAARLIAAERAALGAVRHVITTSATTARCLARDFAVPRARITVARPGTDPVPAVPSADRDSGGPVRLLSVGSLTPRKGHDLLIAALAGLGDLDWRLTIVGPEGRDPAHARALRARIGEAGLAARVTLAGAADAPALAREYAAADLFVLASRYEGYGMAYAEAMAHGLAVLGCDTGAVAEATLGAARLVPPEDAAALGAALGPLIADPSARRALAARCRAAAADLPRWAETARIVAHRLAALAPADAP